MDIQQLRYFVSVSECLNFTQAANRHYIAQTAISYQIKSLEKELGFKLLNRNTKQVELTPAGKVFFEGVKQLIEHSEDVISRSRAISRNFEGLLRVGFLGPFEREYLPSMISSFKEKYPQIDVQLNTYSVQDLQVSLSHNILDVIFTIIPGFEADEGSKWEIIAPAPNVAILYNDHPLSDRKTLKRSELGGESFIFVDRQDSPHAFDSFIADCLKAGFSPKISATTHNLEAIEVLVKMKAGIALLPRCFIRPDSDLRAITLEGEEEKVLQILAWKENSYNPAVDLFINSLSLPLK